MELFKLSDIKAGYLIRCTDLRKDQNGRKFNMTVMPAKYVAPLMGVIASGDLAACGTSGDYLPMTGFGSDLIHANAYRIDEVWGYTTPMWLMKNVTNCRECLWKRNLVKRMTMEEIERVLGYKVKVIKEGEDREPATFKKSSLTTGMVVKLRNGAHRVIVPSEEGLLLVSDAGISRYVSDYNYDLTHPDTHALDVVEVWGRVLNISHAADAFTTDRTHRHRLWQRDDAKRMTWGEIGKALGHSVEVVATCTAPVGEAVAASGTARIIARVLI